MSLERASQVTYCNRQQMRRSHRNPPGRSTAAYYKGPGNSLVLTPSSTAFRHHWHRLFSDWGPCLFQKKGRQGDNVGLILSTSGEGFGREKKRLVDTSLQSLQLGAGVRQNLLLVTASARRSLSYVMEEAPCTKILLRSVLSSQRHKEFSQHF